MTEDNKETRCPFCGLEMDVVAELKDEDGNQRTFYRCETRECPIRINTVTLEANEISEAWCFKEMSHIRAEMTGKAIETAAIVGSRALAIDEVKSLERRMEAAKSIFAEVHSEHVSDDIERSALYFEELLLRELDLQPPPPGFACNVCCRYFPDQAELKTHAGCRPWYEGSI